MKCFSFTTGLFVCYTARIMERLKTQPRTFSETQEFIEIGMREGVHEQVPYVWGMNEQRWRELVDKSLLYLAGPETTLGSIGKIYGVTDEAIRQQRDKFMILFYGNCPLKTQIKYPLPEMVFKKPLTQHSKENLSRAKGGKSWMVKEQLEKGITDPKKIAENLGFIPEEVSRTKGTLYKWGVDLDSQFVSHKKLKKEIEKTTDDEKLAEMLEKFPAYVILGNIGRYGEQSPFMHLGTLFRELRLSPEGIKTAFEQLNLAGIAVRSLDFGLRKKKNNTTYRQIYWVMYVKQRQRAIDELQKLEKQGKIKKVGVKLVAGELAEKEPLPSAYALQQTDEYKSANKCIRETLGIFVGHNGNSKLMDLLRGCPVPVYQLRNRGRPVISVDKEDEFKAFILRKHSELSAKPN